MFSTIVLALDGSDASERGLPLLAQVAEPGSTRLEIVHVRELSLAMRGGSYPTRADEDEMLERVKQRANELANAGYETHLHVETTASGGPAQVIADVAERCAADLIVVGTRGHAPVAGLLLGSVTMRLLHVAPCPVLAIPAGEARQSIPDAAAAATAAHAG